MPDPSYFRALAKQHRYAAAENTDATLRESSLAMAEDYETRADWTKATGTILGSGLTATENRSAFLSEAAPVPYIDEAVAGTDSGNKLMTERKQV
jgi:hypothetical protein